MPRSETIISVFVASPSDVSEERKALESISHELNKTWSKNLNVRLDLVKWETDVLPGFGAYPQEVINQQIDDEYDVFIAIFWGKVGTPTSAAESGTIEEFERAYEKHLKCNDSVDIMVYFKDQPISPSKMDFEQLQKLQALKKDLGEKGGFYSTFDSVEEFESTLRVHLSKIAQKWASKNSSSSQKIDTNIAATEKDTEEQIEEDEDFGLLDYIEIYEDRMFDMTSALNLMVEATEKVGEQFTRRTKEMNKLSESSETQDNKKTRKIVKLCSGDMERYSEILESQIPISTRSREEAFDALSKALSIYVDFSSEDSPNDLAELRGSIDGLKIAATGTIEGISGFRDTVSGLPRLTIQLNKSKRRTTKALDSVLEEAGIIVKSSADIVRIIDDLLEEIII